MGITAANASISLGSRPSMGNTLWPVVTSAMLTILPNNQAAITAKMFLRIGFIILGFFVGVDQGYSKITNSK